MAVKLFHSFISLCLLTFLLVPALAQSAEDKPENEAVTTLPSYTELRQQYQSQLDRCDMLNAQEILSLGTTPMANLKDEDDKWLKLIKNTKQARLKCYEMAQSTLEDAIAAGVAKLQEDEDNTALAAQLELDKQAADLVEIRRKLTAQLLDSMTKDLKETLEKYKSTWRKKDKPSFVIESGKTADLIRQDMGIVLEMERRQLSLEARLIHNNKDNQEDLIKLKLKQALHYLTRALMAYEDINRTSPARLLANLRSEYLYAAGQMHEVLAIAPSLEPLPEPYRQPLLQLVNRMQLLELDIEGALRDFRSGEMKDNMENWLSELYHDLSNLSMEVNNILHRLEMGEPIVVQSGEDLEIPADIAAFIKEDEEQEEQKEEKAEESEPSE